MSESESPAELVLDVDGRRITALRRPARAARPVVGDNAPQGISTGPADKIVDRSDVTDGNTAPRLLCLHGWLDNAASFVPLMAQLPHIDVVAIDLPGHGSSDPLEGSYPLAEMSYRARRVMQALGWERCHLAGHSLGGCIAPLLAVAAPEAIESLILIEASGPLSEEAEALPARLARALDDRLDPGRFASRTFPDPESAVTARLRAARMQPASARLIVERQIHAVEGGWQWRFDPHVRAASAQYQTEAQVRAVLGAVACPTLTIIATEGFLVTRESTEARLGRLAERTSLTLPGHHHVHMDTPVPVAAAIGHFLGTPPAPG